MSRNYVDVLQEYTDRIEALENAMLLLAKHVGAVGWNYELQQALDKLREAQR
jgi:hypothetical protein